MILFTVCSLLKVKTTAVLTRRIAGPAFADSACKTSSTNAEAESKLPYTAHTAMRII
jgi:hypothetical protein